MSVASKEALQSSLSEDDLKDTIIKYAELHEWIVHHDRPALNRRGEWRTHVQGSPGFPDLVLARRDRVLFVELKSARGQLSPLQKVWRDCLVSAGLEYRIWRPQHWFSGEIEQRLL